MHELGVVFHIMDSLEKVAQENEVTGISKSHRIYHEGDELQVGFRSFARAEQKYAGVSTEAPVIVLTGTVNACERFLVEKHAEVVTACYLRDE